MLLKVLRRNNYNTMRRLAGIAASIMTRVDPTSLNANLNNHTTQKLSLFVPLSASFGFFKCQIYECFWQTLWKIRTYYIIYIDTFKLFIQISRILQWESKQQCHEAGNIRKKTAVGLFPAYKIHGSFCGQFLTTYSRAQEQNFFQKIMTLTKNQLSVSVIEQNRCVVVVHASLDVIRAKFLHSIKHYINIIFDYEHLCRSKKARKARHKH